MAQIKYGTYDNHEKAEREDHVVGGASVEEVEHSPDCSKRSGVQNDVRGCEHREVEYTPLGKFSGFLERSLKQASVYPGKAGKPIAGISIEQSE